MQYDTIPRKKIGERGDYVAEELYTWIPFYTELADKFLPYKDNRDALIAKLQAAYESIDMKFPKLDDDGAPADIDPFTIFGLFNKGISNSNRRKNSSPPSPMRSVPTLNCHATSPALPCSTISMPLSTPSLETAGATTTTSTISGTCSRRNSRWQPKTTRKTETPLRPPSIKRLGSSALVGNRHQYLYRARPLTFINLDSRNRWFMGDAAKTAPP